MQETLLSDMYKDNQGLFDRVIRSACKILQKDNHICCKTLGNHALSHDIISLERAAAD